MQINWQTLVVLIVVAAAVGHLLVKIVGLGRKRKATTCGGCGSCGSEQPGSKVVSIESLKLPPLPTKKAGRPN